MHKKNAFRVYLQAYCTLWDAWFPSTGKGFHFHVFQAKNHFHGCSKCKNFFWFRPGGYSSGPEVSPQGGILGGGVFLVRCCYFICLYFIVDFTINNTGRLCTDPPQRPTTPPRSDSFSEVFLNFDPSAKHQAENFVPRIGQKLAKNALSRILHSFQRNLHNFLHVFCQPPT